MRIALVKPSWTYPITRAEHTYNRHWPPLSLLYCGTIFESAGHDVQLIDAHAEGLPPDRLSARIGSADMIFVTSSELDRWQCPNLELEPVIAAIAQLRKRTTRLFLIGFHGTVEPEAMLERTGVDVVIRGEPEETVRRIAEGQPLDAIDGLTFRRDGQIVSTPQAKPVDMTTLPVPAFHLINPKLYHYEILGPRFMMLEGVRGCPYPCTFCSRVMQGRPLRRKTVEQLGREVEIAVNQHGVRNIYFIDLEFTAAPEIAEGISQYLIDHKIKVRWCCQTRTDKINERMLRLMKKAGCRLIHYGVETGNERIAKLTRKMVTVPEQRDGVLLTKRLGIETLCFFLLGHPTETEQEMRQTISFAKQLNPTYASFHRVSPYQGTALFDEAYGNGNGNGNGNGRALFPEFIGSEAQRDLVEKLVREGIWSYYVRPRYVLSRLFQGSPTALWRQLRLFAGYFGRAR